MASDEERARQRAAADAARRAELSSVVAAISQLQMTIQRCQPHMTMVFNECRRSEGTTQSLVGGSIGSSAVIAQLELARTGVADIQMNLNAAAEKLKEMRNRLSSV